MSLYRINFEELYRRHLCRHGHFGINVMHLLAVYGVYFGLLGFVGQVVDLCGGNSLIVLPILIAPWFILVAANCPVGVTLLTLINVVGLVALQSVLPPLPLWAFIVWPVVIIGSHRYQQWGHGIYRMHRDMSAFKEKYPKGLMLFTVLLIYELPILLHYLAFGKADWVMGKEEVIDPSVAAAMAEAKA